VSGWIEKTTNIAVIVVGIHSIFMRL